MNVFVNFTSIEKTSYLYKSNVYAIEIGKSMYLKSYNNYIFIADVE